MSFKTIKFHFLLTPIILLASCAGYRIGETKPSVMKDVKTIDVKMFSNSSFQPRANAVATSAVTAAIVQDGTYRLASLDHADAVLEGDLLSIKYTPVRGSRFDVLRPEELINIVTLKWRLLNAKDPTKVVMEGTSVGFSEFFVSATLQTDRNNAVADAAQRAAAKLVSTLSNGY